MSSVVILVLVSTFTSNIVPINANNIICDSSLCQNQAQSCAHGEDCHIECNGDNACQNTAILCPTDYECTVACSGNFACDKTTINATASSLFELNGCSTGNSWTCSGVTIYFPPFDDNENARALIHGGNQLNGLSQPLQFYAENGWKDIDATGYLGTFAYFDGTMHCDANYQTTCGFNDADWSCQSSNSLCNDISTVSASSSSELFQYQSTKLKSNDILLIIVIVLVVCVCWFGCILTYYVQKAAKLKKETMDRQHIKMEHMILTTPIKDDHDDEAFDIEMESLHIAKQMSEGDIKTIDLTKPKNDTRETVSLYPLPPVHNHSDIDPVDTPNRLPFINYGSVESYNEDEGQHDEHTSLKPLPLKPVSINYSVQEERQQHPLNKSVTASPNVPVTDDVVEQIQEEDDDMIAINNILTQQSTARTPSENGSETSFASNMSKDASRNTAHCHMLMYLYNSDMAIPECSENPQHFTIPTTPKMHNEIRSPTPTLSDTDCPGLGAQMLGPATPKLPASSCCSNSSTSTRSDMTYMTASTFAALDSNFSSPSSTIRSEISSSSSDGSSNNHSPKPLDLKIHLGDDSITSYNSKKAMDTVDALSESMQTPICSNALSVSYSHSTNGGMVEEEEELSVDNNHCWINRNECDMLRMAEEDNDDTSSWVSGDDEDEDTMLHLSVNESTAHTKQTLNTPRTRETCFTSTEYDSSTSSMLEELQITTGNEKVADDEDDSIDFGIQ